MPIHVYIYIYIDFTRQILLDTFEDITLCALCSNPVVLKSVSILKNQTKMGCTPSRLAFHHRPKRNKPVRHCQSPLKLLGSALRKERRRCGTSHFYLDVEPVGLFESD